MADKFQQLHALGAGEFEHLDGSLIQHLQGTHALLEQWSAPVALKDAGLYHAAYGTVGFNESLVSTTQRSEIAAIIGSEAEEIVYQYCACDRQHFFSQIGRTSEPTFKNRFTGETYVLTHTLMKQLCELTAANESEIARDNSDFITQYGEGLRQLFSKMTPYLSEHAQATIADIFES